jgi:hypothetical protein
MTTTDDLAALAADYPGWRIWLGRSYSGAETGWHATARHRGQAGEPRRLAIADARSLRCQLGQQKALRRAVTA